MQLLTTSQPVSSFLTITTILNTWLITLKILFVNFKNTYGIKTIRKIEKFYLRNIEDLNIERTEYTQPVMSGELIIVLKTFRQLSKLFFW